MKKIKKRGAIYGVIALLLCVAVYLNWSYVDAPDELLAANRPMQRAPAQTRRRPAQRRITLRPRA